MNKIKATKKEMQQNYKILSVGYCDIQHLLSYQNPIAYSAGLYGWSCDYYEINDIIISTGYSPINTKNMQENYKLNQEYEQKARSGKSKEEINNLLYELLNKLEVKK